MLVIDSDANLLQMEGDVRVSGTTSGLSQEPSQCPAPMPLPFPLAPVPLPSQGSPGPVNGFQISIAKVQLAAHQNDRSSGAEMLDFRVPHGLDMVEGIRVGNGETQNHHVGSGGRERKVTGRESWWVGGGPFAPEKRNTCVLAPVPPQPTPVL